MDLQDFKSAAVIASINATVSGTEESRIAGAVKFSKRHGIGVNNADFVEVIEHILVGGGLRGLPFVLRVRARGRVSTCEDLVQGRRPPSQRRLTYPRDKKTALKQEFFATCRAG